MKRSVFDNKIAEISKSILSYCITRTHNRHEAEDLAQDIIVELIKSVPNIRDDKAFYGFMWSVASKVYAMWCRKNSKQTKFCELIEDISDETDIFSDIDNNSDLYLLRREMTLLSQKYRKAVILYYLESKSCSNISSALCISDSMVKYLLFKARKILKEGMNMERNYGEQSYNPKTLELMYMGEGPNRFWDISNGKKIPQNILWACYNDNLTEEEISLQIGVALPYLETEIKLLVDSGLLIRKGNKYNTNIIIFTKEFKTELATKIEKQQETIADILYDFIITNEEKIRNIGFHMCDMSKNSLTWHITCVAIYILFSRITEKYSFDDYPVTSFGDKAYVWGDEAPRGILNFCNMSQLDGCLDEGELHFIDYLPNPKSDNNYFYRNRQLSNLFIKLVNNKVNNPNEYEREIIADLIRNGYVKNDNGKISATLPVYTEIQKSTLYSMLEPTIVELLSVNANIKQTLEKVLKNHIPTHLKPQAESIACMRMFDDVMCVTVEVMRNKDYLRVNWSANEMPTVFAVVGE